MNKLFASVTFKLVGLLLAFAVIPLAIITVVVYNSFEDIKEQAATSFEVAAITIADKIDRNLFERYGDVQAFGLNHAIYNRDSWYKEGVAANPIVDAMNQYVEKYGIYYLTVLVDLEGNVIAVNSKDLGGNKINSAGIYKRNYKNTSWFKALAAGNYTTQMPHTAPGNDISSGTYIEDLHIDNDVKTAYDGNDGLTLGFSSPVYQNGEVIAYWSNRTDFSLVEEFFTEAYGELEQSGFPSAELTLLDKDGRVIVDYDPSVKGSKAIVHNLDKVIMKLNLASKGVETAVLAVKGETGHAYSFHARKKIIQAAGYTHLKGALGFPGMNWSVLVRVPEDEAAPWLGAIQQKVMLIVLICIAVVAVLGIWIGRRVVTNITGIVNVASVAAEGDMTARIDVKSKDEFGQLGNAINSMMDRVGGVVSNVRDGSDQILSAANEVSMGNDDLSRRTEEQASSLEETASSMEEMTSTVKQNADNARQANQLGISTSEQAAKGGEVVGKAVEAMTEITTSSKKIADIITVIDEIAFQTNLLALNAAVEAARAGEQGRGFAVVASEVRTLAGRSADAAKEINGLITDSVAKVELGSELVNESGMTLETIVNSVKKVTDIISEIAASSQEQATGIEQVNNAVMQMDEMTQQNAALVEEASAASKSMESQARSLSDEVAFFKLNSSGAAVKKNKTQVKVQSVKVKPAQPFSEDRRSANRPFAGTEAGATSNHPDKTDKMGKTGTVDAEWDEF